MEKMYKVNLNSKLLGLDGNIISGDDATLGMIVSQSIAMDTAEDPIKMFDIATKLYKKKVLELDESDFNMLKDYIKAVEMKTLPKAQILKVFNAVK